MAKRYAKAALVEMDRVGVPPTPENYMIWYAHAAGTQPDLSRVLQALERRGEAFSADCCAEIQLRFFGSLSSARQIDETCKQVERTIERVTRQMEGLSKDTGAWGEQIADVSKQLAGATEVQQVYELMHGLRSQMGQMQSRVNELEIDFTTTQEKMVGLRRDLDDARREANTDGLTGIANRKFFDFTLNAAADEAREAGQPLSLLLVDIDHFKNFNDTHGHQVGDQVLKAVARNLKDGIKGRDTVARYGGEEFALILPQTELAGAGKLADQLRQQIGGHRIRLKMSGRDLGQITLSIGCAQFSPPESPQQALERADQALYRAKQAGRNRVEVASKTIASEAA